MSIKENVEKLIEGKYSDNRRYGYSGFYGFLKDNYETYPSFVEGIEGVERKLRKDHDYDPAHEAKHYIFVMILKYLGEAKPSEIIELADDKLNAAAVVRYGNVMGIGESRYCGPDTPSRVFHYYNMIIYFLMDMERQGYIDEDSFNEIKNLFFDDFIEYFKKNKVTSKRMDADSLGYNLQLAYTSLDKDRFIGFLSVFVKIFEPNLDMVMGRSNTRSIVRALFFKDFGVELDEIRFDVLTDIRKGSIAHELLVQKLSLPESFDFNKALETNFLKGNSNPDLMRRVVNSILLKNRGSHREGKVYLDTTFGDGYGLEIADIGIPDSVKAVQAEMDSQALAKIKEENGTRRFTHNIFF